MSTATLEAMRGLPGLHEYMDELEGRLHEVVSVHGGLVSVVGEEALSAGGKRLRPLLVFLSTPNGEPPSIAAGVAVELVHMATLVHDDLIDGARLRRGRAAAWSTYGEAAARAAGDYLFARAFAALAEAGNPGAVTVLARATLALARGEALQRSQQGDPATSVESYLERCALKTGTLFEAACILGAGLAPESRLGDFGLWLGVAFQIADDILDCADNRSETGKLAGTDLREGTPTLPLLLAARQDEVIRVALAGGPSEGALARVAATGALEESREVALDYASRARACLNGEVFREELEALTHAVVNRER